MKRDWDLIRTLLEAAEALPNRDSAVQQCDVDDWDAVLVSEHIHLLGQAGLLDIRCQGGRRGRCVALGLTWEGHELLSAIRDRTAWNHVLEEARSRGLELSLEVVSRLAHWVAGELLP